MALGIRKLVVIALAGGVFLVANAFLIAHWLQEVGAVEFASYLRSEFLTGTAITIIVVLLILLVSQKATSGALFQRCPVCDHKLLGRGKYCGECGSRV
jgi:hypothetical protein